MVTEPHFQLTTKDHAILQTLLERYRGPRGPYLILLERKVRDSAIYFRDDIPPGVVTLNTRFTYFVNGAAAGPHLVVQSDGKDLPPFALSIGTLRGLALLGLAERGSIVVDLGTGVSETLVVDDVLSQPEAEARMNETVKAVVQGDSAGRTENILSFRPRETRIASGNLSGPDDDDPGPRAA